MFNTFWWIPLVAGFQDGINPCSLINASVILLGILWLKRSQFKRWWILLFIGFMFTFNFILNCNFIDALILNKYFEIGVRCIYTLLALGITWMAVKYIRQWIALVKKESIPSETKPAFKMNVWMLILIMIVSAAVLSLLSSLWPINYYVSVFGVYMLMPGHTISMGLYIALYTLVSLWFVYFVIWLSTLEDKHLRLFTVLTAGIFISASLSTIMLFL